MTRRIGSFFPVLMGLLTVLFTVFVVGPAGNVVFELYRTPPPRVVTVLREQSIWIGLAVPVVFVLTLWSRQANITMQRRQAFALLKPADRLMPQDLDFSILSPSEVPSVTERPFTPHYVRRTGQLDSKTGQVTSIRYDEEFLIQSLRSGHGFVLLGQPTDGKTRTLFEVLQSLKGFDVLIPKRDEPVPADDAFQLVKKRRIILVLDDLTSFVNSPLDLALLCQKLRPAQSWVVAATCRDGPEQQAVSKAYTFGLRRFYEDIPLKLCLNPMTDSEKFELATSVGKEWDPAAAALFPTPGSIVLAEPLNAMKLRFQELNPGCRDVVLALALLIQAGVLPSTHHRLDNVLRHVLHRQTHLADRLHELADQAFIEHPARQDPVQPRPAYVRPPVVLYEAYRNRQADLAALMNVMAQSGDAVALYHLGTTALTSTPRELQRALACFDSALGINPTFPEALCHKGMALSESGQHAAAIKSFDAALKLRPSDPQVLYNKGIALSKSGQHAAAIEVFNNVLSFRPADSASLNNKGIALSEIGEHAEALKAFDAVLSIYPEFPEALHNRGRTLSRIGEHSEAIQAYDDALRIRPDYPDALDGKGVALLQYGQIAAAIESFDAALSLRPEYPNALCNKGIALSRIRRYVEAIQLFDIALAIRPEFPEVLHNKGVALFRSGQTIQAIQAYDTALEIRPAYLEALCNKGIALSRIGRQAEAIESFDAALAINPEFPEALDNKGVALTRIGRYGDAIQCFDAVLNIRPEYPEALCNKGIALSWSGQHAEAIKAFDAALSICPEFSEARHNKCNTLSLLQQHNNTT